MDSGAGTGTVTMHIGELAEKTGLSLRTIRHYDEVGLLKPTGRTEGGFRLYTPGDFSRLMLIRRMKPLGFSLEEMTDLLRVIDALGSGDTSTPDAAVCRELDAFIGLADERRAKLSEQLGMADEFLALLREQQNEHRL
jgi:MerR family copper efflux transcriptional regulator